MQAHQPIGIFDSGIGGLTVASAISSALPNEQLIYFGDTAHLPYGDKSPEAIKYYSLKITRFLIDQGCKVIVIACNTASSLAYQDVLQFMGDQLPIYSVIDPVVYHMVTGGPYRKIGVIATKATIESDIYARQIHEQKPDVEVHSMATPLLVPMIEEGFFNNNISNTIIQSYLSAPELQGIDSLILGCTHYPLIKNEIAEYYHNQVDIIDNAALTASFLKTELQKKGLLNPQKAGEHRFYVSDYTKSFEQSTRLFFKDQIHLERQSIWD
ncbi:glutamate racemase [Mucilaginibacter koreensis]